MRPARPPPPPDPARLSAILAEIGVWLCGVRVWLAEMGDLMGFDMRALRREIRAELNAASRDIEHVLFLLAVPALHAIAPAGPGYGRARWRNVPSGFRRPRGSMAAIRVMRRVFASPDARGTLRQRLARLEHLLTQRDRWIARLVARVGKGPHGACLAPVAPLARALTPAALAPTPDGADTS